MRNFRYQHFVAYCLFISLAFGTILVLDNYTGDKNSVTKKILPKKELKKARADFLFNMVRDPITNSIPNNIRARELKFAKTIANQNNSLSKTASNEFQWAEVGPNDIGGRTRALAIDVTNSNTIIAAGVSGGIWKSTNNGDTWEFKSKSTDILSVTSIVQDPRSGQTNNWYAVGGEFNGSSASDRGFKAYFRGNGILKSTDNGETWNLIASSNSNPNLWDSDFDYMSKLVISPTTGTLFGVSHGVGVIKSIDGGESFSTSLGGLNDHYYNDLIVKPDGTLIGILSSNGFDDTTSFDPGVYTSANDGATWTNITPTNFPIEHRRSVLGTSNLSSTIFYILTYTGETSTDGNEVIRLFRHSTDNSISADLSANLPTFESDLFDSQGHLYTQSNYNMAIAVKPDDDNFVLIGGTSLFRSTDGFSSKISNRKLDWIGGYHPEDFFYPNLHPDVHIITFDPNNSNHIWVGHDGGLSYTSNILENSYLAYFPWENKNNAYNVTQFYTVSIPKAAGDTRIMGGTQDNGTPYFIWNNLAFNTSDISSGDGAYCYFSGGSFAYTSIYNGNINRLKYNSQDDPVFDVNTIDVTPEDAEGQLFINPFVIDPNPSERYMYYPAGHTLWRNSDIRQQNAAQPITQKWSELTDLAMPSNYNITTLAVSTNNPEHVLYYGASNNDQKPLIYKLLNSSTATSGFTNVSIPDATEGAYIHHITVNPDNGNEIIAVFSNYNIIGVYHSNDGGSSYTAVEGNLIGDENNPGPSIRRALIQPYDGSYVYFLATSTGLYSTTTLDGENTNWQLESPDGLGNVVVEYLDSRTADNTIAVATHGRGIFIGTPNGTVDVESDSKLQNDYTISQNYPNPFNPVTKIDFSVPSNGRVKITVYNNIGEQIKTLTDKQFNKGNYSVSFDGSKLASGIYFYKFESGSFVSTKKMILMK